MSDGLAGARGSDELLEQALREQIIRHALRMPLNSHDPVGITDPFDAFDRAIPGVSSNAELFARFVDGLVMAAVDFRLGRPIQTGKPTIGRKTGGVFCVTFSLARREIGMTVSQRPWFHRANVLNQRPFQMDIQALAAITNCEDRFAGSESALQDCEIRFLPIWVGVVRLFAARGVVERWIKVCRATRKNKGIEFRD